MALSQFFMPSNNLLGAGALDEAVRQLGESGFRKALIVTDAGWPRSLITSACGLITGGRCARLPYASTSASDRRSASRTTGTTRPLSVPTATPM